MASVFDMFDHCSADARGEFERRSVVRRYTANAMIYHQGDPGDAMYRVIEGSVRLSVSRPDGRELWYVLLGAGNCFGVSNYVDGRPRPQTAEAGTAVTVQQLGGRDIDAMIDRHPSFSRAIMRNLSCHLRLLVDLFADASLNDLPERVARRIVGAAEGSGGTDMLVSLSQADLARMVGASRQSVNKVLQHFQDDRLITTEYGGFRIRSLERLRDLAFDPALSRD